MILVDMIVGARLAHLSIGVIADFLGPSLTTVCRIYSELYKLG